MTRAADLLTSIVGVIKPLTNRLPVISTSFRAGSSCPSDLWVGCVQSFSRRPWLVYVGPLYLPSKPLLVLAKSTCGHFESVLL